MEYKMKFNEVRNAYMNRAGFLMEDFFSDMLYDIQRIENMEIGKVYFFVVQPSCTHIAEVENYDEIRDLCAQFWGNYVIFRIENNPDGANRYSQCAGYQYASGTSEGSGISAPRI